MSKHFYTVLSIAGSDSIGGAGIQADIKTCCAHGVYSMTAITAVTAQNTRGVAGYEAVSAQLLAGQLEAIVTDVRPDAVKIGMLPNRECREIVALWLKKHSIGNVVLDPVMVATSGDTLSDDSDHSYLVNELLPLATVITPNIPEAIQLFEATHPTEVFTIETAGIKLLEYTPNVLIKGGHGEGDIITDTLFARDDGEFLFRHGHIETVNTHGTGCSLSAAIACRLAMGTPVVQAVEESVGWLQTAIERGKNVALGGGRGPVGHLNNYIYKEK